MKSSTLLWSAILLFVSGIVLVALAWKQQQQWGGASLVVDNDPPIEKATGLGADQSWLTEFELTERSEKPIGTKQLAGKIHLVSFFFATCPGSCRQQNRHFGELEREFGKRGVKFVAITCDPKTDSPAKLREYASLFNAPADSWYFLTGNLPYTRRVAAEIYGVALDEKTHVERFILVDRAGKVVGRYAWASDKEMADLKTNLRKLLEDAEKPSAAKTQAEKNGDEKQDEASPSPETTAPKEVTGGGEKKPEEAVKSVESLESKEE